MFRTDIMAKGFGNEREKSHVRFMYNQISKPQDNIQPKPIKP